MGKRRKWREETKYERRIEKKRRGRGTVGDGRSGEVEQFLRNVNLKESSRAHPHLTSLLVGQILIDQFILAVALEELKPSEQ